MSGTPRVHSAFSEEQSFQIIPQSDGNNWKIGREGKDREETKEVMDNFQVPRLIGIRLEIECVQVADLIKCKNPWKKRKFFNANQTLLAALHLPGESQ